MRAWESKLIGATLAVATLMGGGAVGVMPAMASESPRTSVNAASGTITLHGNGGSSDGKNTITIDAVQDSSGSWNTPLPPNTFVKEGYRFLGWSTYQEGANQGHVDYADGATLSLQNANLYAVWASANDVYTVRFDANGGWGSMPAIYVKKNGSVTLPDGQFLRDNYKFRGYARTADDTVNVFVPGRQFTATEDTVLYATWTKTNTNIGGAAPMFAGQDVMARGVALPEVDLTLPETSLGWDPTYNWYDIYQYDSNYCWAASASNALHWWVQNNAEYISRYSTYTGKDYTETYKADRSSSIFDKVGWNFANIGGWSSNMFNWYLTGKVGNDKTGYYRDVLGNHDVADVISVVTKASFNATVRDALMNDKMIAVAQPGHAFTMWGAHFDEDGFVDRAYFTDSSNISGGLYEMNVYYKDGKAWISRSDTDPEVDITQMTTVDLSQNVWEEYFRQHPNPPKQTVQTREAVGTATTQVKDLSSLKSALKNSQYGTIQLTGDITVGANDTLTVDRSVTIDFNGHNISRNQSNGSVMTIGSSSGGSIEVTLRGSGAVSGGKAGVTGAGGVNAVGKGTKVTIDGIDVRDNTGLLGGGVRVAAGASVTLKSGTIRNNTAEQSRSGKGGGVFVEQGTFTMDGGTITGNSADFSGGGVAVSSAGTMTMNGGSITDNQVTNETASMIAGGAGIGAYNAGSTIVIKQGTITGNKASGANAYAGGVLVNGGLLTVSGSGVQITDNTATNTTFGSNTSNVVLNGVADQQGLEVTGASNGSRIGVQLFGDATGMVAPGKAAGKNAAYATVLVSDNPHYEMTAEGALQNKGTDYISFKTQGEMSTYYGDSTTLRLAVKVNGVNATSGSVTVIFPDGTAKEAVRQSDGYYTVDFGVASQGLGMHVGDNAVKVEYRAAQHAKANAAATASTTVNYTLYPYTLTGDTLAWHGDKGRTVGDGKSVTATIKESAILAQDVGKVNVVVDGGNAQTAGNHAAQAIALSGSRAEFYQLEPSLQPDEWQHAYTITGNGLAIDVTPQETTAKPGQTVSFDAVVKSDDTPVREGTLTLTTAKGKALGESVQVSKQGFASVSYTVPQDADNGDTVLTLTYSGDGFARSTSAPVTVHVAAQLKTLHFDGTLEASGPYKTSYNGLAIVSKDGTLPTDDEGNKVEGKWKWRVDDYSAYPEVADTTLQTVIFVPKRHASQYAELIRQVDPKITKIQGPKPGMWSGKATATATTVSLPRVEDTLKNDAPAEYAIAEVGKSLYIRRISVYGSGRRCSLDCSPILNMSLSCDTPRPIII